MYSPHHKLQIESFKKKKAKKFGIKIIFYCKLILCYALVTDNGYVNPLNFFLWNRLVCQVLNHKI